MTYHCKDIAETSRFTHRFYERSTKSRWYSWHGLEVYLHTLAIYIYFYYVTQTLTHLELYMNQIDNEGVLHLSRGLQNNEVEWIFFPYFQHILSYCWTQTLICLDLFRNRIGNSGVKHLSNLLRYNKVKEIFSLSLLRWSLLFDVETEMHPSFRE